MDTTEYLHPAAALRTALTILAGVMSGPLVRSSYKAGTMYRQGAQARDARGQSNARNDRLIGA